MENNKVNFLFCGDSYTWGEELQGPEGNHTRRINQRFSHVVSTALNKTYENISHSGRSNDWIVKKTIQWFEAGNSCDTAIIQFSHPKRWIWYDMNGNTHHMPGNYTRKEKYLLKNFEKQEAQKAYFEFISSRYLSQDNYWKNMFLLRNYLKDKCDTIHLTLTVAPRGVVGKDYKKNFWYQCVGDVKIIELQPLLYMGSEKNIENWCPELRDDTLDDNNNKRFSGTHPSAKGHQKIAESILNVIK